jgi:hypothetical protein
MPVAGRLIEVPPSVQSKQFAATQAADEARVDWHSDVAWSVDRIYISQFLIKY